MRKLLSPHRLPEVAISSTFTVPVRYRFLTLLAAFGLVFALVPAPHASAQVTFTVDSTADEPDANPGDGDCETTGGDCTLRAAVQEANVTSDDVSIQLPANTYVLTSGTQIDVTNTDHVISIQGGGADTTIIDGNEATRIFDVATGADLSIDAVTLTGASGAPTNSEGGNDGGAVYNGGTFTASSSVFRDSTTPSDGGALENDGTMIITDSEITGNVADDEAGAVDNDTGADLTVTGTLIASNSNNDDNGGAIENEGTLTTMDTIFRMNTANEGAGAIFNSGGTLDLTRTTFEENTAPSETDRGGAIINSGGTLTIAEGSFDANAAGDEGGAIYNDGDISITGSAFVNNSAGSDGGGAIYHDDDTISIVDTVFTGNTTDGHGGAIFTWDQVTIESSTFETNTAGSDDATDSGGAIYNVGSLSVTDSTFRDNVAPGSDSYGGGIENDGGQVDLRTSTLVGNDAHEGGGFSSRAGFVDMTNVTISGNTADVGAGIYAGISASMTLSHVTVARNTAATQGGGIDNPDSEVRVGHTLIAENSPENCSGGDLSSLGHNVTDDASCTLLSDGPAGDQTDVTDAHITDLGDYGGDTQVHALLSESPAIDVAESGDTDETCEDTEGVELNEDQRGAPRLVDGDDSGTAFCDAGAFEFVPPDSLTLSPADATNDTDTDHTVTATVSDTLEAPSESITVRFAVDGANSDSGAVVTDANGEASFTYTGSNAGDDTIDAYVDTDGDGTQDEGEPSDTATKTWVEPEPEPEDETVRLWGENRWTTAIDISQDRFPVDGSANTVVLARGDDPDGYADALAGAPLSVCQDAPLLITLPDELLQDVENEIQRVLGASGTVILLGQTDALSADVEAAIEALGYSTDRIGGAERIETSILIADRIESDCYTPDNVLTARAFHFADALSGGAAAASNQGVIVLNGEDSRNHRVESYIGDHSDASLYALGGQIAGLYPEAEGLFGTGRIETAVEVANEFFTGPTTVGVSRADRFPDPLTGGAHIGENGGPILLTQDAEESNRLGRPLDPATADYLCTNSDSIATAYIYGGVVAISADTETAIADRISGQGC